MPRKAVVRTGDDAQGEGDSRRFGYTHEIFTSLGDGQTVAS